MRWWLYISVRPPPPPHPHPHPPTQPKSSRIDPQPSPGFCHEWSAACHWSRACWWGTSSSGYSRAPQSLWGWRAAPGGCAGISAWTCTRTGLSSSWLCSAWAQWSSPSRRPRNPRSGGSGSSGTRWSARRSPDRGFSANVWSSLEPSPPGTAAGIRGEGQEKKKEVVIRERQKQQGQGGRSSTASGVIFMLLLQHVYHLIQCQSILWKSQPTLNTTKLCSEPACKVNWTLSPTDSIFFITVFWTQALR